jgi:flagellin
VSMRINTNIEALNAQRNLTATANKFASSVEKLSSGLRINRAADDAAGLGIAEKLQAQVQGLNQAQRNAQDGISMVQTAEGALTEVHSMLQRIRELAVEAGNSTVGTAEAGSINAEITSLQAEINRIAQKTTFNGQNLLTGALAVGQAVDVNGAVTDTLKAGAVLTAGSASVSAVNLAGAKANTQYVLTSSGTSDLTLTATTAAGVVTAQKVTAAGMTGATTQTLNFSSLGVSIDLTSTATTSAANVAVGLQGLGNINTGTGSNATFQIGANEGDNLAAGFANAQTSAYTGFDTAVANFTSGLNTTTAGALITATDTAIAYVSGIRGGFGAVENRLTHTVASISVASENLNASESRIKDLDVASEMVNFTKTQILQQAGTSILAQANSAPQSILTLLR